RSLLLANTDAALRTSPGASIGACALTAHGHSAAVAQTAIAPDIHQALDVERDLTAKIALDAVLLVDNLAQAIDLIIGQVAHAGIRIDSGPLEQNLARVQTNAVNIGKRSLN